MTPAGFRHGTVTMILAAPLGHRVKTRRLGVLCSAETGFMLARGLLLPSDAHGSMLRSWTLPQVQGIASVSQITARLPDGLVEALDAAAKTLRRSRAEIVRQAVERYLQDYDDLTVALERLRDPSDPVLDWDDVRHEVLGPDQAERSQGTGSGSEP